MAPLVDLGMVPRDFQEALALGHVTVALQPLVNIRSGGVARLEALARWQHPVRGQIAPATFIPLAESCREVTALAFRVLGQVARYLPAWREQVPDLRVAVNVSVQTMQDPLFPDRLAAFLKQTRAHGDWFELEITESTFMHDPERALQAVEDVRRLGLTVSIDDYGTGYSSLGYLANLPVNAVKIDRQFVIPMTKDHRREKIVRATIALGHDLGFEVVAEGVEDRETLELLGALGCDLAQGYHLARPMPSSDVSSRLATWDVTAAARPTRPAMPRRTANRGTGLAPRPGGRRSARDREDDPRHPRGVRLLRRHGCQWRGGAAARRGGRARGRPARYEHAVLDGQGFVAAVRERGLRVPIVIMTAGSSAKRWATQLGADAYLSKPFELLEPHRRHDAFRRHQELGTARAGEAPSGTRRRTRRWAEGTRRA